MTNDETFVAEFEACRWPLSEWHHRDHIKLAYLYISRYSFEDALCRIRDGIQAHNAAHQLPDSLKRGYHETMTHAWLRLVHFVIREYGLAESADEFYQTHAELSQKKTLRLFYSRERLISPEAKAEFCEPDLTAFPESRNRDASTKTQTWRPWRLMNYSGWFAKRRRALLHFRNIPFPSANSASHPPGMRL